MTEWRKEGMSDWFCPSYTIPEAVRQEIQQWVQSVPWPEGTELKSPDKYHITACYSPSGFGDQSNHERVEEEAGFVAEVKASHLEALSAGHNGKAPVGLVFESEALSQHALALIEHYESKGLPVQRHDSYKPHITVAFTDQIPEVQVPEFQFTIDGVAELHSHYDKLKNTSAWSKVAMPVPQSWLDQHIRDVGRWAYHSTREENIPDIMKYGLIPGKTPGIGAYSGGPARKNHVFLNLQPTRSQRAHFDDWQNNPEMNEEELRVDLTKLDPANFNMDDDWNRNVKWSPGVTEHDAEEHVLNQIEEHGTVAYMGRIPPDAIEVNPQWEKSEREMRKWDWEEAEEQANNEWEIVGSTKTAMPYDNNTWYHVTHRDNLQSIRDHGLVPTNRGMQDKNFPDYSVVTGGVYLAESAAGAYGIKDQGLLSGVTGWEPRDMVMLQITGIDRRRIHPDPERLTERVEQEFEYLSPEDIDDSEFEYTPLLRAVGDPEQLDAAGEHVWGAYKSLSKSDQETVADLGAHTWVHLGTIPAQNISVMDMPEWQEDEAHRVYETETEYGLEDSGDEMAGMYKYNPMFAKVREAKVNTGAQTRTKKLEDRDFLAKWLSPDIHESYQFRDGWYVGVTSDSLSNFYLGTLMGNCRGIDYYQNVEWENLEEEVCVIPPDWRTLPNEELSQLIGELEAMPQLNSLSDGVYYALYDPDNIPHAIWTDRIPEHLTDLEGTNGSWPKKYESYLREFEGVAGKKFLAPDGSGDEAFPRTQEEMASLSKYNPMFSKVREANAKMAKPKIQGPIPFIYSIDGDIIHTGHPGERHSDIKGKFAPGGVVRGFYMPNGEMQIRAETDMPYTLYHMTRLWYHLNPELEVKSIYLLHDGKRVKLASKDVANKVRNIAMTFPAARKAFEALSPYGDVFVVGGAIRDVVLGKTPNDIDMMVSGIEPDMIEDLLAHVGKVDFTGQNFGVYRLKTDDDEVEIALPRTERSTGEGHKDFEVVTDHTLSVEEDLARRDFSINSMAVNMNDGTLIDPYDGVADLVEKRFRVVNDKAFEEDPLRILRALTALSKHGTEPDELTIERMKEAAPVLEHLPAERVGDELDKILSGSQPQVALRLAMELGLLQEWLPEIQAMQGFDQKSKYHNLSLDDHTFTVLENMVEQTDDIGLRWAALLHDSGKPESQWFDDEGYGHYYYDAETDQGAQHEDVGAELAQDILRRLKRPEKTVQRVSELISHHMFPAFEKPKGARKFLRNTGDHADDVLSLRWSDDHGKADGDPERVNVMRQLIQLEREQENATSIKDLAINGRDLLEETTITQGPDMGATLQWLLDKVEADPSLNTRETLLDLARQSEVR